MATSLLIIGESGAGKTTSLRTLNPETTLIIDADRKGASWRGWKKQYNTENKNFLQTSKVPVIEKIMKKVNDELTHIKVLVIDGLSTVMVDDEVERMKEKGYDRWISLAQCIWGLVSYAPLMRDDLTVVFIGHSQTERDENGYEFTRLKTSGRKLDKLTVESKFNTVLLAKCVDGKHIFETYANRSTAKSPLGCFDKVIENDMKAVIDSLIKYEEGEP